jgi:FkbM family methyltransferase
MHKIDRHPAALTQRIQQATSSDNLPVFVYGAGLHASEIESFFQREGIHVRGFIVGDEYIDGPHRVGGQVMSVSKACSKYPHFHTVIGFCRDPQKVESELAALGIGGAGQRFAIDCRFWRQFQDLDEQYLDSMSSELSSVRELFYDDLSRKTFDAIVVTKVTHDPARLAELMRNPQYFPRDLAEFAPHENDVIVDAGAFTGDTLAEYLDLLPTRRCKAYHAFEPDPNNAARFMEFVRVEGLDFVQLHQVALGSGEGKARFTAGGKSSSKLDESAGFMVPVASLDSFGIEPTLIKMDVEGAEPMALNGARATIASSRPRLAVTIYHSLNDFLGIPRLAKELCEDYRLSLRIHRPYTEEFVLYATV